MAFGENLAVMQNLRHPMSDPENPICQRCGFRTYPRWGEHDCITPVDVTKMRHVTGDLLSNLHFYRIPIEMQVGSLALALAWTMASNCQPSRIHTKLRSLFPEILDHATR